MVNVSPIRFWIVRRAAAWPWSVSQTTWLTIPEGRRDGVLSCACEDWCYDNLDGPVLAEWLGLELRVGFATWREAALFRAAWL